MPRNLKQNITITPFLNTPNSYQQLYQLFKDLIVFNVNTSKTVSYYPNWEAERKKDLDRFLSAEDCIVHLAENNNQVIGYGVTYANKVTGYCVFEELYIKDEYRTKGLGHMFLEIRKDWCKKYGFPIKLEVYKWNRTAIAFHIRNGFKYDSDVYVLDSY